MGEGFPVSADLGGELHTDEGVLFLFGPAEPGQFRPASGRVEGQAKVAVVWAMIGTDADFAVHETGTLGEELQEMAVAERAAHRSIFAPGGPGSAVSGTLISRDQPEHGRYSGTRQMCSRRGSHVGPAAQPTQPGRTATPCSSVVVRLATIWLNNTTPQRGAPKTRVVVAYGPVQVNTATR